MLRVGPTARIGVTLSVGPVACIGVTLSVGPTARWRLRQRNGHRYGPVRGAAHWPGGRVAVSVAVGDQGSRILPKPAPVRSGSGPDPGAARAQAEIEGRHYAGQSRDSKSRDQNHAHRPECRAWWGFGALARHDAADDASLPYSRERPEPADDHRFLLTSGGRRHTIEKVLLNGDNEMYRIDHGLITVARLPLFARARLWRTRSPSRPPARRRHFPGPARSSAHKQ